MTWHGTVQSNWIDYNGHLNDGYYAVAFSLASENFLKRADVYSDYRQRSHCTVYTVETHISYLRELKEAEPLRISCQLIDFDSKRIHIYLEMFHATENYLAATYETLLVHVDQSIVRVSPMPAEVKEKLEAIAKMQNHLKKPKRLHQSIKPLTGP